MFDRTQHDQHECLMIVLGLVNADTAGSTKEPRGLAVSDRGSRAVAAEGQAPLCAQDEACIENPSG